MLSVVGINSSPDLHIILISVTTFSFHELLTIQQQQLLQVHCWTKVFTKSFHDYYSFTRNLHWFSIFCQFFSNYICSLEYQSSNLLLRLLFFLLHLCFPCFHIHTLFLMFALSISNQPFAPSVFLLSYYVFLPLQFCCLIIFISLSLFSASC